MSTQLRAAFAAAIVLALTPSARADRVNECADAYEHAQELRLAHKLRAARKQLEVCSQNACPAALRTDCVPWLRDVSAEMPSIVIAASPSLDATVDGERATIGDTIEVDPGAHHVVVTDPATHATASADVTVNEGDKKRAVDVALPQTVERETPPPKKPGPPFYAWIAGGIGVAGMISFAAWGAAAIVLENDLKNSCYGSCTAIDVERVHNRAAAADVSLAIGIAGLVTAAVIFVWPRHPKSSEKVADVLLHGVRF